MLEVGQGHTPEQLDRNTIMSEVDISNAKHYFSVLLDKDSSEATIDELLDCLQPQNAVERIAYRKSVGSKANQEFVRLTKGARGQA